MTSRLRLLPLLALLALPAAQAEVAATDPFLWRNSAPVTAPFGLPRARSASLPPGGAVHADWLLEVASHFTADAAGTEAVFLDGETTTAVFRFERGFDAGFALGIELVGVRHSGGFLDGFIDRWHDFFGLPDGGRDSAPRDRLLMSWEADGETRLLLDSNHTGPGDLRVGVARQIHRSAARDVALRLDAELPTGRAGRLTGSGGVDLALGVAMTERAALEDWGLTAHLGAGILRPGGKGVAGARLRSAAGYGNVTLAWRVTDRIVLKAQLDGHSDLVRSELRQIGGWSVQGGLGIAWQATADVALEFGVHEDLRPGSAPDVSFQFALRARRGP